jgi:hypothetical protein
MDRLTEMSSNNQANYTPEGQPLSSDQALTLDLFSKSSVVALCPDCTPGYISLKRRLLPSGHLYFFDDEREKYARLISWRMSRKNTESWFATQTFPKYVIPQVACAMSDEWLLRLDRALMDTVSSRLIWFRAAEWQQRKVIHFHLLLMGCKLASLSRKRFEARWENTASGYCRIHEAEPQAAPYLAKYMNKTRGGELQWGGAWQGVNVPKSVESVQGLVQQSNGHALREVQELLLSPVPLQNSRGSGSDL